jgi:hypothetical protein
MNQQINLRKLRNENSFSPTDADHPAETTNSRRPWWHWLILVLVVVVVGKTIMCVRDGQKWRAVFLTNNQVYFGKFTNWPFSSSIWLRDIYYLQVSQNIQQQNGNQNNSNPEIKVIKLGSEMHGPEDLMVIPHTQVAYWEYLKASSAIVQTIENFEKENK